MPEPRTVRHERLASKFKAHGNLTPFLPGIGPMNLVRRAGFRACRFTGQSCPVSLSGDWKVARTGRQECLPYIPSSWRYPECEETALLLDVGGRCRTSRRNTFDEVVGGTVLRRPGWLHVLGPGML